MVQSIRSHATTPAEANTPAEAKRAPRPPHGAGDVRLLERAFSEDEATSALRAAGSGRIGAIVTFTGVVRADEDDDHGAVTALGFDTYPEMALAELRAVRAEALRHHDLAGLTIWHRTDTLPVGTPIVLVAAAARHRDAAFAAAAWAMDEVKRRVPLWKRETRADGSEQWVHADSCMCGHGPA